MFSHEETKLIKGSIDFIGINHYTTLYVKDCISSTCSLGGDHPIQGFLETTETRDGIPIGDQVYIIFLNVVMELFVPISYIHVTLLIG